jgi:hypothetical protein
MSLALVTFVHGWIVTDPIPRQNPLYESHLFIVYREASVKKVFSEHRRGRL